MADRGLTTSIPIWVRVSGIIALVLVGVVVSSMVLGGSSLGGHGRGGQMGGMDHNGAPTGQAAPSGSEPAENPAHSGQQSRASMSSPTENEFSYDEPGHRDAGMFGVLRVVNTVR